MILPGPGGSKSLKWHTLHLTTQPRPAGETLLHPKADIVYLTIIVIIIIIIITTIIIIIIITIIIIIIIIIVVVSSPPPSPLSPSI